MKNNKRIGAQGGRLLALTLCAVGAHGLAAGQDDYYVSSSTAWADDADPPVSTSHAGGHGWSQIYREMTANPNDNPIYTAGLNGVHVEGYPCAHSEASILYLGVNSGGTKEVFEYINATIYARSTIVADGTPPVGSSVDVDLDVNISYAYANSLGYVINYADGTARSEGSASTSAYAQLSGEPKLQPLSHWVYSDIDGVDPAYTGWSSTISQSELDVNDVDDPTEVAISWSGDFSVSTSYILVEPTSFTVTSKMTCFAGSEVSANNPNTSSDSWAYNKSDGGADGYAKVSLTYND